MFESFLCQFKLSLCDEIHTIDVIGSFKIYVLSSRKFDRFHVMEYFLNASWSQLRKYAELPQKLYRTFKGFFLFLSHDP